MTTVDKRRSWDEVLFENEYFLLLSYAVYLFFTLGVYFLKSLLRKLFRFRLRKIPYAK